MIQGCSKEDRHVAKKGDKLFLVRKQWDSELLGPQMCETGGGGGG